MDARIIERNARQIIREALKHGSFETIESMGCTYESCFLGTVFNLTPSGKFYTPWANSNVDTCNHCKGHGILDKIERTFVNCLGETITIFKTCNYCGGMGSREAYEDSIFTEAMEKYAQSKNCFIESGEGDPCDIFLCRNFQDNND